MTAPTLSVGCVVLSQGNRPDELRRAIESVLRQDDVDVDVVVVGNGWTPVGLPAGARGIALPDNVGIPAGRNVGAGGARGDLLLFLDDDAELDGSDFLRRAVTAFEVDPLLAVLQPRAVDPTGLPTARRHVPRLGAGHPDRAGDVAWFWEGCSIVRRSVFDDVGRWPGEFFYGHEGIELAWRILDAGYRVHYAAGLRVRNPEDVAPFRDRRRYLDARNRVWVARRNLPWPLAAAYLAVWVTLTLARLRSVAELRIVVKGYADGARRPAGDRRPIRWRTAWRLTRLGRPPVV